MKTIMHIFAIVAMLTGAVTIWHAIMPSSACWLTHQELVGCVFIALLSTIVSCGLTTFLEEFKEH
jgi:uncharacterized BrkB/YihY/UPF0761 family membrane protein